MEIKQITIGELKRMTGTEGLILQGCGGDPEEWANGINETLTEAGILPDGSKFNDVSVFEHDGLTNILFGFDDMNGEKLDVGKLAMWRLQTHDIFGGTWLSDYLPNRLGVRIDGRELSDAEVDRFDGDEDASPSAPSPIAVYIENAEHPESGGFTMPLPATAEELAPFLAEIKASCLENIAVLDVKSPVDGLSRAISLCAGDGLRLDELNYLAAKIRALNKERRDVFGAVVETKRHCGSIAEIINITQNLECFYLQPAHNAMQYGEFLLDTTRDEYAELLRQLENSSDPLKNDFAAHIDRLEASVNAESYGKYAANEEGGVFTAYGYLTEPVTPREIYRGSEDIPAEYRLFDRPEPLSKVENADLGTLLTAMRAVGGEYMRDAKHKLETLLDGGVVRDDRVPDLTREKKPPEKESVLAKLREAQLQPKPPCKPKNHNKSHGEEL
jgi:hypothetical protein